LVLQSQAACATADPDLFFPDETTPAERIEEAKAYCASCPIKQACLEDAIRRGDWDAICGGTTPAERRSLVRAARRAPGKASPRQLAVKHGAHLLVSLVEWQMSLEQVAADLGSTSAAVYRAFLMLTPPRLGQQRAVPGNVIEELLNTSKEQLRTLERRGLSHSEIGVVLKAPQSIVSAALSVLRQREEGIARLSTGGRDGLQRMRDEEVRVRLESGVGLSPQDVVEAFGRAILRMRGEGKPLRHIAIELDLCRETVRKAYRAMTEKTDLKALKRQDMEEAA
jgi:WhiB family redox-sensing transcriptional regulator